MPSAAEIAFAITAKNETKDALSAVKGDLDSTAKSADDAGGHFAGLKEHLGAVADVMGGLLGAQALGGLSGAITGSIGAANGLGASVKELQDRIGGTAEDSSRLIFAFQQYGLSSDQAQTSLDKFSKGIKGFEDNADGTTKKSSALTDQLKALGVQTETAGGAQRSMNDILGDVADKFQNMPDGPNKTALAMQLFGKSGTDLIPILDQGRGGMAALGAESDKLGHTLTEGQLAAMHQNTLETAQLHAATEGLRIQLGVALLPMITSGTELLTQLATAVVEHVIPGIQRFADLTGRVLAPIFKPLSEDIEFYANALLAAVKGQEDFGAILGPFGDLLDLDRRVIVALGNGIFDLARKLDEYLVPVIKSDVIPVINQLWSLFTTLSSGPFGMITSGVEMLVSNWGELVKVFPGLGEAWDKIEPQLESLGNWLKVEIPQAIEAVQPKLQQLSDWFSKNLGAAIAAVGPMFQQFGQALSQNLLPILTQVFSWLGSHESVLLAIVGTAGIVGLVATIGAIPVAIAAISAAVVALVTHWGDITSAVGNFIDAVEKRFPEVGVFITQVQNFFTGLWVFISQQFVPGVTAGVTAIVDFIQEHWAGIKDLLTGPFDAAKTILIGILDSLKVLLNGAFVELGNILNLFGDLFKGNWGKLWGDVVDLITTPLDTIKSLLSIQLTVFEGLLSAAWETIKAAATQAWNEFGGTIEDAISGIVKWIKTNWADVLLTIVLGPVWLFRDQIGGVLSAVLSNVSAGLQAIVDWVKAHWVDILVSATLGIMAPFYIFRDQIGDVLGAAKDAATGVLHDIWQWITDHFSGAVHDLLFNPFNAFRDGIGAIMRDAGNAMLEPLRGALSGVNAFLGGIADAVNWISGKLGLGDIIPKGWSLPTIPQLASGTDNFQGGLAIVGEQGPELVHLPAGAAVLPAGPTDQLRQAGALPGFFLGLDPGSVIDAMKSAWNGIKDFANEWISKGADALFTSALAAVGFKDLQLPGVLQDLVPKLGDTLKTSVVDGVKELLGFAQKATPAPAVVINGTAVQLPGAVADWLAQGAQLALGRSLTPAETQALYWLIGQESGGDPNQVNPVAVAGEHATGILQTLPSTFAANAVPGHTNILNPVDNIAAALRYILAQYGDLTKPTANEQAGAPGYAAGTSSHPGGPALVGEAGPELVVLPAGTAVLPASLTSWLRGGMQAFQDGTDLFETSFGVPLPAAWKPWYTTWYRAQLFPGAMSSQDFLRNVNQALQNGMLTLPAGMTFDETYGVLAAPPSGVGGGNAPGVAAPVRQGGHGSPTTAVPVNITHIGGQPVGGSTNQEMGFLGQPAAAAPGGLSGATPGKWESANPGWGWFAGRFQILSPSGLPAGIAGSSGMAEGGVIDEPIFGIGLSGRRYQFGERGPETVTPGVRGGGDLHIHIHALDTNGVKSAIPELTRLINKHLLAIGQPALVPNGR